MMMQPMPVMKPDVTASGTSLHTLAMPQMWSSVLDLMADMHDFHAWCPFHVPYKHDKLLRHGFGAHASTWGSGQGDVTAGSHLLAQRSTSLCHAA